MRELLKEATKIMENSIMYNCYDSKKAESWLKRAKTFLEQK